MRLALAALVLTVLTVGAAPARAQDPEAAAPPASPADEGAPRQYASFRVGASTANESRRPELCLEVAPFAFLSLEACGTGSGFLHHDPEPEIAHFLVKVVVAAIDANVAWIEPQLGAGFAELQIGADDPGFDFGGTGARAVETAGPELAGGARALVPIDEGFEAVMSMRLGLAWFPYAPELAVPASEWVPSLSFTLGAGF